MELPKTLSVQNGKRTYWHLRQIFTGQGNIGTLSYILYSTLHSQTSHIRPGIIINWNNTQQGYFTTYLKINQGYKIHWLLWTSLTTQHMNHCNFITFAWPTYYFIGYQYLKQVYRDHTSFYLIHFLFEWEHLLHLFQRTTLGYRLTRYLGVRAESKS